MAKTTECVSSLHGINVDTLLSTRVIENYVGPRDFQELAGMVTDGSHFTLWSILMQLRRKGVRTEILNKIIEGVRGASYASIPERQGSIDELQAENARVQEEPARRVQPVEQRKNADWQDEQGADDRCYLTGKEKPRSSAVVKKLRAQGKADRDIALYMLKNGYKKVEAAKALYPGGCTRSNLYKYLDKLMK